MDKFSDYSPISGSIYNRAYLSSTPDVLQSVCVDEKLSVICEALLHIFLELLISILYEDML